MIIKHKIFRCFLSIACLASVCLASCTYDYFEDETNYAIYVPKANRAHMSEDYRVDDIRLLIYQDQLEHDTKISFPFDRNARTRAGNFNFKLYPRMHSVFCLANTEGIDIFDCHSYGDAGFGLEKRESNSYTYTDDLSTFYAEYKSPYIDYPGPQITDVVPFEKRYMGKLCFAVRNIQTFDGFLPYEQVTDVVIRATGAGTYQKLALFTDSIDTRSSRYSIHDRIELKVKPYLEPIDDYQLGFHCYMFPSLSEDLNNAISLEIDLMDNMGRVMYTLNVDVTEVLHMNETLYQGIDGDKIYKLSIDSPLDWNSDVEAEGNTTPDGGGIEM